MQTATADDVTIINFGMRSPLAATVMDLLTAVKPKAVLFLSKCGGLKKRIKVGEFILPIAAIRGEGTSDDYQPSKIPALPTFRLQMAVSHSIKKYEQDYWTGTVFTTNRRVWEHDEHFRKYLKKPDLRNLSADCITELSSGRERFPELSAQPSNGNAPVRDAGEFGSKAGFFIDFRMIFAVLALLPVSLPLIRESK